MPRTGTSSIQQALSDGTGLPAGASCEYPRAWRADWAPAHHPLAAEVLERGASGPLVAELLSGLGSGAATTVVSSEELTNGLHSDHFEALCEFIAAASVVAKVRFVLAVRRFDQLVASGYRKELELGDPGPAGNYAWHRFPWIEDVFANLARLRDTPEPVSPVLVTYLEGEEAAGPVLRAMGIEPVSLPRTRLNASLGLKACVLLASLEDLAGGADRGDLVAAMRSGELALARERRDFCVLGAELRRDLHAHALESAQRHGHREYVDAFARAVPDAGPRVELDPSLLSEEDLAALERHLAATLPRV
jgi:hypothetical protein